MNKCKIILSLMILFAGIQSFALGASDITCPSIEQLKKYHLDRTEVRSFDQQSKQVHFFGSLTEFDNANADKWYLIIDSMRAKKGDNLDLIVNRTIAQLEPVSADPFQFEIWSWKLKKIPVCIYTAPGTNDINAMALFYNPDFDADNTLKEKPTSKHIYPMRKSNMRHVA